MKIIEMALGPWEGKRLEVGIGLTIGRNAECGLCIESDGFLSQEHACLVEKTDGMYLMDLKSSNGTFYRGENIQASVKLAERDLFVVGATPIYYRANGDAGEQGRIKTLSSHVRNNPRLSVLLNQAANISEARGHYYVDTRHVVAAMLSLKDQRFSAFLKERGVDRHLPELAACLEEDMLFEEDWVNNCIRHHGYVGDQNTILASPKVDALIRAAHHIAEAQYGAEPYADHLFLAMLLCDTHFLGDLLITRGCDPQRLKQSGAQSDTRDTDGTLQKRLAACDYPHPLVPDLELLGVVLQTLAKGKSVLVSGLSGSGKTALMTALACFMRREGKADPRAACHLAHMGRLRAFADMRNREVTIRTLSGLVNEPHARLLLDDVDAIGPVLDPSRRSHLDELFNQMSTMRGRLVMTVSQAERDNFLNACPQLRPHTEVIVPREPETTQLHAILSRHLSGRRLHPAFEFNEATITRLITLGGSLKINQAEPGRSLTLAHEVERVVAFLAQNPSDLYDPLRMLPNNKETAGKILYFAALELEKRVNNRS